MQPVSFSPVLKQPRRFAGNPKALQEIPPREPNNLRLGGKPHWLIKAGFTGMAASALGLMVTIFTPPHNYDPLNRTKNLLEERAWEKSVEKTSLEKNLLNRFLSQQDQATAKGAKNFTQLYWNFSDITLAEADLKPALAQLSAKDLRTTKDVLDTYQKMPHTAENASKLYQDWATAVLLPRLGLEKTQELTTKADQYFKSAALKKDAMSGLLLAFMGSLATTLAGMVKMQKATLTSYKRNNA